MLPYTIVNLKACPPAPPSVVAAGTRRTLRGTIAKIPKSFVFSRDKFPSMLHHLQQNLGNIMLPYTAVNLKVCPPPPPPSVVAVGTQRTRGGCSTKCSSGKHFSIM
jgi:hypothetical protein